MKYYGTPNTLIRVVYKVGFERRTRPIGRFNSEGVFETEDQTLIKRMNKHFAKAEEERPEKSEEKPSTDKTIRHCKKCDYTCETQGQLLKHYREEHKKDATE